MKVVYSIALFPLLKSTSLSVVPKGAIQHHLHPSTPYLSQSPQLKNKARETLLLQVGRGPPSCTRSSCCMFSTNANEAKGETTASTPVVVAIKTPEVPSMIDLLRFAGPALALFLCAPFMSLVDTIFVGKLSPNPLELAALNPAVTLTDNCIFLFAFLPKATTGLVARALVRGHSGSGDSRAGAREVVACALKVALVSGLSLASLLGHFAVPLLGALGVSPSLRSAATDYIQIRALSIPAALMQVCEMSARNCHHGITF